MSELSDQVRAHFKPRGDLYELRHNLARVMNETEWQKFRKVTEEFGGKRNFAKRAFELDYNQRFDEARRRLIDEAGSIKRSFVPKFMGSDHFDKTEINRRADKQVRDAHEKDLARIDVVETGVLRDMLENCEKRVMEREKPLRDFQKAVDRRAGSDRRVRSWSR
ncbi:hypothetical protein [Jannaschia sp. 2305UL9-9]|uniref:hypothetical protein n=1 Tax=Jannaschia sp. 2305UL9-9 TaxID=3121638 RepID=UPI003529C93A